MDPPLLPDTRAMHPTACGQEGQALGGGWRDSLTRAAEVGVSLQDQSLGINLEGVEEGEEVLSAEDRVSEGEGQGGGDEASAILDHPRAGAPLHGGDLSGTVDNGVSCRRQTAIRPSPWGSPLSCRPPGEEPATHLGNKSHV